MKEHNFIQELTGNLRKDFISPPEIIQKVSGIRIFGKLIRSILFTTDVVLIKNTTADAIIAVYPFTPHPAITEAILSVSDIPVLCGVGGGLTQGIRSVDIALHAEFQGAMGVVLNAPTPLETITKVSERIDVPVIITIVSEHTDVQEKIDAGAELVNVSGGANTPHIVSQIRRKFPNLPIIATGGKTTESIEATIDAGANAITFTPPSNAELFKVRMERYRHEEDLKHR